MSMWSSTQTFRESSESHLVIPWNVLIIYMLTVLGKCTGGRRELILVIICHNYPIELFVLGSNVSSEFHTFSRTVLMLEKMTSSEA